MESLKEYIKNYESVEINIDSDWKDTITEEMVRMMNDIPRHLKRWGMSLRAVSMEMLLKQCMKNWVFQNLSILLKQ